MENKNLLRIYNLQAPLPVSNNNLFEEDARALLSGRAEGNLSTYFYDNPHSKEDKVNGYALFVKLCDHPDYYLRREEIALLNKIAPELAATIGKRPTVVELGPGSQETVAQKTLPLLQMCDDVQGYVAVDYNATAAVEAAAVMQQSLSGISTGSMSEDFTTLKGYGDNYENPVFLMFGNTLGNIQGRSDLNNPGILAFLKKLRSVLGKKGRLVVAYDCNEDVESVRAAYNNAVAKDWIHNIIFRLQRNARLNINPDAFEAYADFKPGTYCVEIGVRSLRDQIVNMSGERWVLAEGQRLHTYSSYKFTPEILSKFLSLAGLSTQQVFVSDSKKAVVHVIGAF